MLFNYTSTIQQAIQAISFPCFIIYQIGIHLQAPEKPDSINGDDLADDLKVGSWRYVESK